MVIKMKKIAVIAVSALISAMSLQAFAEGMVTFSGTADMRKTNGRISVMTLKYGSDRTAPGYDDIGYINQTKADADGKYSISIPLSQLDGSYEIYSDTSISKTVYVSSGGSDTNDGTSLSPFKTLTKAVSAAEDYSTIVLCDIVAVSSNTQLTGTSKKVTVTGKNPMTGEVSGGLDLTGTVSMHIKLPMVLENMTVKSRATASIIESANKIFAWGNRVVFGKGLVMSEPIDIFGGTSLNNTCESTDITVMSGTYRRIFGGGENAPVTGDTKVTVYGMNSGYSAEDNADNYYDSRIFGGGKNDGADVSGSTYINFKGGVVSYIVGGGSAAAVLKDTHISFDGGRVMNIYGGTVDKKTVHNGNSYIDFNGGTAESIFGGSQSCNFVGNTHINAAGGEVLRRIYGGCYNDWGFKWASDYGVSGDCITVISPKLKAATRTGLSSGNSDNSGIFAGSRTADNKNEENAVLVFVDGAYETLGSKTGDQTGWGNVFKPNCDYIVKAGTGGSVKLKNGNAAEISCDSGKRAYVNGKAYLRNEYTLSSEITDITFEDGVTIDTADGRKTDSGISFETNIGVGDRDKLNGNEKLIAVISDNEGNIINVQAKPVDDKGDYNFSLANSEFSEYKVRLYIWNMENLVPLSAPCTLIIR